MDSGSYDYVEEYKRADRPNPQSIPHGSLVGNKVLTAQETHVYDTVMSIVDQNNHLKTMLKDQNQQVQLRVEFMKRMKEDTDKKMSDLQEDNHRKIKLIKRLEKEINLSNESAKYMESWKQDIIDILEKMTAMTSRTSLAGTDEGEDLYEIMQDITHKEDTGGYVIVTGGENHKAIQVTINEKLRQLDSFKSLEAQGVRNSLEALQNIYKQHGDVSSKEKQFSLKEYVALKSDYEDLVSEMNVMREVKDENKDLKETVVAMTAEKENLKKKLQDTEGRLRSLENESFELSPAKMLNNKDVSKELEAKVKMIQQLQADLRETEEALDNNLNKNEELEDGIKLMQEEKKDFIKKIEDMQEEKKDFIKKIEDNDKMLKMIRRREGKDGKTIDDLKGKCKELEKLNQQLLQKEGTTTANNSTKPLTIENQLNTSVVSSADEDDVRKTSISPVPKPRQRPQQRLSNNEESLDSFEIVLPSVDHTAKLNSLKQQVDELTGERDQCLQLIKELEEELHTSTDINEKLENELSQKSSSHSDDQRQQIDRLLQELTIEKQNVESLQRDQEDSMSQIIQHQDKVEGYQRKLEKLKNEKDDYYRRLFDNVQIKEKLEQQVNDLRNENEGIKIQFHESLSMTEDKNRELSEKNNLVKMLKHDNESLQREYQTCNVKLQQLTDEIAVHQLQATMIQSDFKAEREAREKQVDVISRLNEELETLKAQNKRFEDDLKKTGQRQFENIRNRHSPYSGSPVNSGFNAANSQYGQHAPPHRGHHQQQQPQPQQQQQGGYYRNWPQGQQQFGGSASVPYSGRSSNASEGVALQKCPKCQELLPDLQTLEIHLMECLDN